VLADIRRGISIARTRYGTCRLGVIVEANQRRDFDGSGVERTASYEFVRVSGDSRHFIGSALMSGAGVTREVSDSSGHP